MYIKSLSFFTLFWVYPHFFGSHTIIVPSQEVLWMSCTVKALCKVPTHSSYDILFLHLKFFCVCTPPSFSSQKKNILSRFFFSLFHPLAITYTLTQRQSISELLHHRCVWPILQPPQFNVGLILPIKTNTYHSGSLWPLAMTPQPYIYSTVCC